MIVLLSLNGFYLRLTHFTVSENILTEFLNIVHVFERYEKGLMHFSDLLICMEPLCVGSKKKNRN